MAKTEVKQAAAKLQKFLDENSADMAKISSEITKICQPLIRSHSDSWAGYHANLYYGDFQTPPLNRMFSPEWGGAGFNGIPSGWSPQTLDDVWTHIRSESKTKFDLDEVNDKLDELQKLMKKLKSETELVIPKDSKLEEMIKKIRIDISIATFIKAVGPKTVISRDSLAINQGLRVPPHIQAQGFSNALSMNLQSAEELLEVSDAALRERGSKSGNNKWNYFNPVWLIWQLVRLIIKQFKEHTTVASLSSAVLVLVTLLAIDYTLAWSNTQAVFNGIIWILTGGWLKK